MAQCQVSRPRFAVCGTQLMNGSCSRDGELSVDFDFHYSTTLTDFIRKLLHPEPKLRPTALETIVVAGGQFDNMCNSKVKSPSESMNVNNTQVAALMAENERLRALLSSMVPPKA